jgi:hypothetical protein
LDWRPTQPFLATLLFERPLQMFLLNLPRQAIWQDLFRKLHEQHYLHLWRDLPHFAFQRMQSRAISQCEPQSHFEAFLR